MGYQGIRDSVLRFKKAFCVSFRYSEKYTLNELRKVLSRVRRIIFLKIVVFELCSFFSSNKEKICPLC